MARTPFAPARAALAATLALCAHAHAEAQDSVTITGRNGGTAGLAGFGDAPLARTPLQASVVGQAVLADQGISQFSGLTRLDASASDAYNAEGYWSNLSVRGYVLDNRFNYRRDGLPINAETAIALDNKERLELLKGTSGVQAGTSAPGGLLNLVVKRPNGPIRTVRLEARASGSTPRFATRRGSVRCLLWRWTGNSRPTRCCKPKWNPAARASPAWPASACWATPCRRPRASIRA